MTITQSIRRVLQYECHHDFLKAYRRPVGGCRPAFVRMFKVLVAVRSDNFPNCSSLATTLGCCSKTIMRDIRCLRNEMGIHIEFDALRKGYFTGLGKERG